MKQKNPNEKIVFVSKKRRSLQQQEDQQESGNAKPKDGNEGGKLKVPPKAENDAHSVGSGGKASSRKAALSDTCFCVNLVI